MPRIKSLTIREEFNSFKYDGFLSIQSSQQGGIGYPIPSLPIGYMIDTDSNIVTFVGNNGSGKSTLLSKLYVQCNFCESTKAKYFNIESEYDKITFNLVHTSNQPRASISDTVNIDTIGNEWDKQEVRQAMMSSGQFQWDQFERYFIKNNTDHLILALDEPESHLDVQNQLRLVEIIREKSKNTQVFIGTNSPLFFELGGKVINLSPKITSDNPNRYATSSNMEPSTQFYDLTQAYLRKLGL